MDIVSESVSETSGIDDLVSEQLGEAPSAPVEAAPPAETSPDVTPEPQAQASPEQPAIQAVAETPNAQTAPLPTPQTYKIGDRDYTAQELQAALTSSQQLGHLQNKYVGLLEQQRQWEAQQRNPQPPSQPQAPQPDPKQWVEAVRQKYDPVVKDLVSKGLMEADFATLFPGMAAQMLAYRDGFQQTSQAVQAIRSEMQGRQSREQSMGLVNTMSRSIQQLAQSGEAFAPLKDPAVVQKYFQYLYDLNPMTSQVQNPQFLASQWVAFNKDQFLQQQQARAQAQARTEAVRYARADATTAARPAGLNTPVQKTPLDQIVDDFYDRSS